MRATMASIGNIAAPTTLSCAGFGLVTGISQSIGQEPAATEVAYVEGVRGRAVAMAQGRPTLLDTLDPLSDKTQIDLLANSELRLVNSAPEH